MLKKKEEQLRSLLVQSTVSEVPQVWEVVFESQVCVKRLN